MSTLHRLKAYFGMVPAEEFDAAGFGAADFDDYHHTGRERSQDPGLPHHSSERGISRRSRAGTGEYDNGFSAPAGHHRSPTQHPARSYSTPARATSHYPAESWATEAWSGDTPVRGSLAMEPVATDSITTDPPAVAHAQRVGGRPAPRQSSASPPFTSAPRTDSLTHDEAHPLARIVTLHPHSYNEARPIGERYREGNPVIMNLTAMEDRDAKRLVDFAAGLAFALRGSIDKVTNKVFLLSPPDIDVSAEDRRRIAEGSLFS